jgi:FtsP/CotA-like multicopper oxidase with cupredoxin domain
MINVLAHTRLSVRRLFAPLLFVSLFLVSTVSQASSYTLYIKAGTHTVNGAGGTTIKVWGYTDNSAAAPMVPGPVIESHEGETVSVYVYNQDSRPHNFVVAGLTTDTIAIPANSNKTYTFTTPNAGVYLYSDTLNSNVNREMGLYGAVVVRAAGGANVTWTGGPSFNYERLWVVSDMDKPRWNDIASTGGTVNTSVYKPNYFMMNGLGGFDAMRDPATQITGTVGQVTLVRIVNAGQFDQSLHFHSNHMKAIVVDSARVTPFGDDTINIKAGKTAMVLFPIKYAKQTFPVHVHTAQMETANGVYLNGAATLIVGK